MESTPRYLPLFSSFHFAQLIVPYPFLAARTKKSREPVKDFLLGGAAGGRLVFSFYGRGRLANGKLSF